MAINDGPLSGGPLGGQNEKVGANAAPVPNTPVLLTPANGAADQMTTPAISLTWNADYASTYDVYLDIVNPPLVIVSADQVAASYACNKILANKTYYWKIVAKNAAGSATSAIQSFATHAKAWTLVNHTSKYWGVGATNGGVTDAIDTTGATFLVAAISNSGTSLTSFTDSYNNVWTLAPDGSGGPVEKVYFCSPAVTGTGHTFTVVAAGTAPAIVIQAWISPYAATQVDVSAVRASAAGPSIQFVSAITPPFNDSLIISVAVSTGNTFFAIDSGFTITDTVQGENGSNYGISIAYLDQLTAAAVNPLWTNTVSGTMNTAMFSFTSTPSVGVRVTQLAVESVTSPLAPLRMTQLAVETMTSQPVDLRFTQLSIETITLVSLGPGRGANPGKGHGKGHNKGPKSGGPSLVTYLTDCTVYGGN